MTFKPFARLLGLQRTANARERLHALRQRYALTDDDPVRELVAVVEQFCAELQAEARAGSSIRAPDQALALSDARTRVRRRIVVLCSAGAALQTFLLATSAHIGAHATTGYAGLAPRFRCRPGG
jgi:hypothetical protein